MARHTVQVAVVDRDILELAANMVSPFDGFCRLQINTTLTVS